jgi:transglutaminase-like putative cysteine protease
MRIRISFILALSLVSLCLGPIPAHSNPLNVTPLLEEAGTTSSPDRARLLKWKKEIMDQEFPHSEKQALAILEKAYPEKDKQELAAWLADPAMVFVEINGEKRYFDEFLKNILFRNPTLIREKTMGSRPFYDSLEDIVFPSPGAGYAEKPSRPYINPVTYQGQVSIALPRQRLPESGNLEIWAPLPIATASQTWPRVLWLTPEKYVVTVPRTDGDIGFVHFSIPLEELKDDLEISVGFSFTHYQQRFQVDPGKVLPYLEDSELFKQYTRTYGNTAVTPAIAAEAQKIVGHEKNPYLAAQKIYRHIVDTIPYSLVPHATVQMLGIPESVYVFENRHGDCGAQSMYFSALCRSLGIPARTTGGYQAIPKYEGTHFWAEFYVEGYGWIPVDPTVAEVADWTGEVTDEQRQAFKYFFFGNLDPYRFVIQKDVDLPVTPIPTESMMTDNMPMLVVQGPVVVCTTCQENPFVLLDDNSTVTYFPVDQ